MDLLRQPLQPKPTPKGPACKMSSASSGGLIALPTLRATYTLASRRFGSLAVWGPGLTPG